MHIARCMSGQCKPPTVYILGDAGREPVPGQRDENLAGALSPDDVVSRAPARYCTEQQAEIVFTCQLLRRRRVIAQSD